MKTEVIMKRPLFGINVRQKHQSEFLSATDIVIAGNKWKISNGMTPFNLSVYLQLESTKEFLHEVEKRYGCTMTLLS